MARKEQQYRSSNSYETPEPHAKPGYTGYFPDSGPKRLFQMSKVYERQTHDQMRLHPVAGLRFGSILDNSNQLQQKLEDEAMAWKHETTTQNVKLRKNMIMGYTGHVPKRQYMCGRSYSDECKSAIALFEKLKSVDSSRDTP